MVLREEWRGTIPEPSVSRVPEKRSRRHCVFIAAVAVTVAIGLRLGATEVGASDLEHYGAHTLVLLRHGESEWNLENRFTGWVDVDVSEKGAEEAIHAGKLMHNANLSLDVAFTSYQKRAIKTLNLALEEMNALWIPVTKSWKLNERMYGDLQGLDKKETSEQFGEEKVSKWRRSFAVPPPPIKEDSPYHPKLDPKYKNVPAKKLPTTESLSSTIERVMPFFKSSIAPELRKGKKVLVAAHGNSLRALVKYLDDLPEEKIVGLNIPTGVPLVYRLNHQLKPVALPGHTELISGVYLGDPAWVQSKIDGVKNQAHG